MLKKFNAPFRLSLKWRVIIAVNAVFFLASIIYWHTATSTMSEQFERERLKIQQAYVRELNVLLESTFQRLNHLAFIIPNLKINVSETIGQTKDYDEIESIFDRYGTELNLEYGLDKAWYFRNIDGPDVTWNADNLATEQYQLVRSVFETEQPQSSLICTDECSLFNAVPILTSSSSVNVLLLSTSIGELIVDFQRISGTHSGIISLPKKQHISGIGTQLNQNVLKAWHVFLHAYTGYQSKNEDLLKEITNKVPFDKIKLNPEEIQIESQWYEIQLVPLSLRKEKAIKSWVFLISNITKEKTIFSQHNETIITTTLFSLVFTSLFLFFMLWPPLRRLAITTSALPLFIQKRYDEIRSILMQEDQQTLFVDEIAHLQDSTISLSYQLENLHTQVVNKTETLVSKTNELARERDFVTGLINTSQAVILTQDINGRILMINERGKSLLNIDDPTDTFYQFELVMAYSDITQDIIQELYDIRNGMSHHLHHESRIMSLDGVTHTISWYHSMLSHTSDDDHAVMMSIGMDITERKIAEEQLAWVADHDQLTKLFNRRRFHIEMERTLEQAKTTGQGGALLYFDVDHFKFINDSRGHQAGDRILQFIADKLKLSLKKNDVLARLGGDEFCIILRDVDQRVASKVAERINESIRTIHCASLGGTHKISVSIGIVMFPDDGINIPDLLANADIAMYKAKENQRGSFYLYSNDAQSRNRVHQLMTSKQRIEYALEKEKFILYYQPIYSIADDRITHYETLIRMIDNDGSVLFPGSFIPEAEQLGLIQEIDKIVVKKAIKALKDHHQVNDEINISVNLSGKAIDNIDITAYIEEILAQEKINSKKLIFELTETVAVSDISKAEALMGRLKEVGCRFALDDFGVGFSSFIYLRQLPVDYVKIDGMFIKNIHNNEHDQIFVRALNEVAHALGKKTIAEFVENEQVLKTLEEIGVDYAQGYHIGKPEPYLLESHQLNKLNVN